jgi:hypothetical protein
MTTFRFSRRSLGTSDIVGKIGTLIPNRSIGLSPQTIQFDMPEMWTRFFQ